MNAAKSLHFRRVEKIQQPRIAIPVNADIIVQWITEDFRGLCGHNYFFSTNSVKPRTAGPVWRPLAPLFRRPKAA